MQSFILVLHIVQYQTHFAYNAAKTYYTVDYIDVGSEGVHRYPAIYDKHIPQALVLSL